MMTSSMPMYFHSELPQFQEQHENTIEQKPQKREKRKYRCRKRSPATIERAKTVRRDKANARERRRMNSLNDALEHLRTILPSLPDEPKMTKIETLRKAQEYIADLYYQATGTTIYSASSSSSDSPASPSLSGCDGVTCGCCSSVQSTPFQSPFFPPPVAPGPQSYPGYPTNSHLNYRNPAENNSTYFSPHYPKP